MNKNIEWRNRDYIHKESVFIFYILPYEIVQYRICETHRIIIGRLTNIKLKPKQK